MLVTEQDLVSKERELLSLLTSSCSVTNIAILRKVSTLGNERAQFQILAPGKVSGASFGSLQIGPAAQKPRRKKVSKVSWIPLKWARCAETKGGQSERAPFEHVRRPAVRPAMIANATKAGRISARFLYQKDKN